MTRQRNDIHSTEFGLWLRNQPEIDSANGYVATNIDYLWASYISNEWMLIEEKRYNKQPSFAQKKLFEVINNACKPDKDYRGFHYLVFENTSPEDGRIFLDGKEINKLDLISFLEFRGN
jgi:hypothetical protein